MDKRKIKTPGVLRQEAAELLELVKDEEIWAENDDERIELGKALTRDIMRLPMVGFDYKALYVILRFLVMLNNQSAGMAHYVRNENEELLCDVLAAGITSALDDFAATNLFDALKGIEITIREVDADAVQR